MEKTEARKEGEKAAHGLDDKEYSDTNGKYGGNNHPSHPDFVLAARDLARRFEQGELSPKRVHNGLEKLKKEFDTASNSFVNAYFQLERDITEALESGFRNLENK